MPEMSGSQRRAHIERVRSQQQAAWMEQRRLAADREHVLGTAVAGSTGGGGGGGAGLGSGGGAGLGSGGGGGGTAADPAPTAADPAAQPRGRRVQALAPGAHDAAVLDRLTERISDRLRSEIREELEREASELEQTRAVHRSEAEDSVERYLTGEMASQTCSICMELMVAPKTPMMLFPCGHTFCSECLSANLAKGGAGKNKCPYCRATIESKAPNLTLQQLVRSFVDKQSALKAGQFREVYDGCASETKPVAGGQVPAATPPSVGSDLDLDVEATEVARHRREFRLQNMRWKILRNERSDTEMELEVMDGRDAATGLVLERLEAEEKRIGERMAALHAELELVRNHKEEQRQRIEVGKEERALCRQRIGLIDEALEPLSRERNKLKLLLEASGETLDEADE
jgi:hypothetical protein